MALKGTLRDFSLADIFQLIGIQRKTGVLTLKSQKEVVTVSFVEGSVVSADALQRRLEDRLGTVLVKSGRISEMQLQEALRIQKNTLKRMGSILVENRFIDAQALRDALQVQISQMVYRLFRWRDGEYDFSQEGHVDYDKDLVSPMSAESILMEGARILDEWPMIEKGIGSFGSVFRHANVEIAASPGGADASAGDEAARAVTLNDQERLVYALVDGKRTVQEIIERSALSEFDTCRILFELIGRHLVEETRAAARKAAEIESPRPAPTTSPATARLAYLVVLLLAAGAVAYRIPARDAWIRAGDGAGPCLASLVPAREVGSIQNAIGASRLQRIEFAIEVYYLLNRGYPQELRYLVTDRHRLLRPGDLLDPWARPFGYEVGEAGYTLTRAIPGGASGVGTAIEGRSR
jgi:hypothetical protein